MLGFEEIQNFVLRQHVAHFCVQFHVFPVVNDITGKVTQRADFNGARLEQQYFA